jgi:hypothetical protein
MQMRCWLAPQLLRCPHRLSRSAAGVRVGAVLGLRATQEEAGMAAEIVLLDGPNATLPWPLALAEELLADAAPWGPPASGPDDSRYADVWRVAAYVNAYHRHPPGSDWRHPLRDDTLMANLPRYTTQQLLDGFFMGVRGEHFSYGLTRSLEPRLRVVIGEVVRRVCAADPPVFVLQA